MCGRQPAIGDAVRPVRGVILGHPPAVASAYRGRGAISERRGEGQHAEKSDDVPRWSHRYRNMRMLVPRRTEPFLRR